MKTLMTVLALLCPTSAWADISDSGNLVIGGTATIQGSAFSVGGSTLSVALGTITAGGLLQLSVRGVKFGDGTTQTSAFTGPSNSTHTFKNISVNTSLTSTSFGPCFSGSTVSFRPASACANGLLEVILNGSARSLNEHFGVGFLINGSFPPGFSQTVGAVGLFTSSAGDQHNVSFTRVLASADYTPNGSGDVSLCLTGASGASSVTLGPNAHALNSAPRFGIICR